MRIDDALLEFLGDMFVSSKENKMTFIQFVEHYIKMNGVVYNG